MKTRTENIKELREQLLIMIEDADVFEKAYYYVNGNLQQIYSTDLETVIEDSTELGDEAIKELYAYLTAED